MFFNTAYTERKRTAPFILETDHPSGTNLGKEQYIVRLIIRLRIDTGKQTDDPSRRTIWIIRLHRRITGDNSSERIIRL